MATTALGNNYLFWIESATAGAFVMVAGQGNFDDGRSQASIDTSSKETGGYDTEAFGNIKMSPSLTIRVKLPDAGYTRLETIGNALGTARCQVRKNGAAGVTTDAIFDAVMNIGSPAKKFPQDGVVEASVKFGLSAAPIVDALA